MDQEALSNLSRPNVLRVGINLGNILLVTGKSAAGAPEGVAPDMAAALAERLGASVEYVTYPSPGEVADAVAHDEWDVGLIAEEPKRAESISFCGAYVEIEATYLVPEHSPLKSIKDVDRAGVRIAVSDRSAYDLYLSRTLEHAELCRAQGLVGAYELFVNERLDALAGLRPALKGNAEALAGSRVMDGGYTSVRQAIGTKPGNTALKTFAEAFIVEARESGLVRQLIEKHGVVGKLQVATAA